MSGGNGDTILSGERIEMVASISFDVISLSMRCKRACCNFK